MENFVQIKYILKIMNIQNYIYEFIQENMNKKKIHYQHYEKYTKLMKLFSLLF